MVTCHDCSHLSICRLRYAIDQAVHAHIGMINVDVPTSDPKSFIHIYKSVAATCKEFKEFKS